jgi:signal transduction histidine kinase
MAIRAKLVLIVFFCAILPMFLVTARWNRTAVSSVTAILRDDLNNYAHLISLSVDKTLRARAGDLRTLASSPTFKNYLNKIMRNQAVKPDAQVQAHLNAFALHQRPQCEMLTGVSRSGQQLFSIRAATDSAGMMRTMSGSHELSASTASAEIKDYENALKATSPDQFFVSDLENHDGHNHLRLLVPIFAGSDVTHPAMVLIAQLNAAHLLTEAAGPRGQIVTQPGEKVSAMWREAVVFAPDGTVLYSFDEAKQGKKYSEAFPDFAAGFSAALMQPGRQRMENDLHRIRNEDWLIRARQHPDVTNAGELASPKLSIITLEKHSDAVTGLEFAGFTMYLLTLALAVAVTLALYYLISNITDSIRRVTRGARAITAGKLDHRIKVRSSDETRVLADAFNRMAERLREMIVRESEQKQFESFARLSAVLTHDLKNSIFSLSLLVQNMERKFDREGFREDAMRTLSNSVNDLQAIVARLSDPLAMTSLRQASDLSTITENVLKRIGANAGTHYAISSQLQPQLMANVDAKAIERVIENLMINALEAMPEGGKLKVHSQTENESAVISVADTGKGMSEEFVSERLFRPFATTKKKGIGLGLYSCRDIIEQHGGRIDVSSQVGAGTEFRVIIPLVASLKNEEKKSPIQAGQTVGLPH